MKNKYNLMFTLVIVSLLSITLVSAAQWDNVKSYDPVTNTVTFKDSFLRVIPLDSIGNATLETPQIYQVPVGYQKIAQFKINPFEDYPTILEKIDLIDLKTNKTSTRQIDIKYWGKENYSVPFIDCTNKTQAGCFSSNKILEREVWLDWDKNVYQNKEVTVGLFMNIGYEETFEWIPTIAGIKVTEWAVVTSGATTSYYVDGGNNYTVLSYANNGTFNLTDEVLLADILLVAGGGGGGTGFYGGGGGGGGVALNNSILISPANYTITVGVGGGGSSSGAAKGSNGQNSSFNFQNGTRFFVAWGGGGGGSRSSVSGANGGSGGGGSQGGAGAIGGNATTVDQGKNGGNTTNSGSNRAGSGGGGAGFVGAAGNNENAGSGGNGTSINLNGTAVTYAGGGGGSVDNGLSAGNNGWGGLGGGGNGSYTVAGPGINGTGGGGGGGDNGITGGMGGTGYVMIRYITYIPSVSVTLNSPANATQILTNFQQFNSTVTNDTFTLTNATLYLWYNNGTLSDTLTNTSFTGTTSLINYTGFPIGTFLWNVLGVQGNGNGTNSSFASGNRSITYDVTVTNQYFTNATNYETALDYYIVNVTTGGVTPTNAYLVYNNTIVKQATVTDIGNSFYNISSSLDIPLGTSNNSLYFNMTVAGTLTSTLPTYQDVYNVTLLMNYAGACPAGYGTYINYTAQDEVLLTGVDFTILDSVNYYLGTGSIYRSFLYQNTSENEFYSLCFSPQNKTVTLNGTLQYGSTGYPTRSIVVNASYTNSTLSKILYLLANTDGIYVNFNVVNGVGNNLENALVVATRTISGSPVDVASGLTDASGLVTFFLYPNIAHTITASYPGLTTFIATITPTQPLYTINLGGGGGITPITNGSSIGYNLSVNITPTNSTLLNNTNYVFGLNVTGDNILFISENITNITGAQFGYNSSSTGLVTLTLNTGTNQTLVGTYIIQTATENLTYTRTWLVTNYYSGSYSLYTVMSQWGLYGFVYDYYRVIIFIVVLLGAIGGLSAIEITDTSESKIGTGVFIIWIFSYVGWLTINISVIDPTSSFYAFNQFANKYGIAILSSAGAAYAIKEWLN